VTMRTFAALDFPLPVKFYNIYSRFIGLVELENIDFALQMFLCCLEARDICLRSSSGLESAILNFYFRSARTVLPMCHMDRIFKDFSNDVLQAILFAV